MNISRQRNEIIHRKGYYYAKRMCIHTDGVGFRVGGRSAGVYERQIIFLMEYSKYDRLRVA